MDRLSNRIKDSSNKSLSFAGRLQLIQSVLSSMHIYWASVFILLARIVHDLEQLMRNFFGVMVIRVEVNLQLLGMLFVCLGKKEVSVLEGLIPLIML